MYNLYTAEKMQKEKAEQLKRSQLIAKYKKRHRSKDEL